MFVYEEKSKRPVWNREGRRISLNVTYYQILALETFMSYVLKQN